MIYMGFYKFLAEAVRFELTEDSHPRQFSRLLHSTALPRFRARSLTVRQAGFDIVRKKTGIFLLSVCIRPQLNSLSEILCVRHTNPPKEFHPLQDQQSPPVPI